MFIVSKNDLDDGKDVNPLPIKLEEVRSIFQKNAARSKKVDSAIKGNSVLERVLAHNKAKWKTTAAISRKLTNEETTPMNSNKPIEEHSKETVINVYTNPSAVAIGSEKPDATTISDKDKLKIKSSRNVTNTGHVASGENLVKVEQ